MENDVLELFCNYIKNGGRVIILGEDSLKYQKYDTQPADENLRNFIFENSIVLPVTHSDENVTDLVYPTENDLVQEFYKIYDNMGLLEVKVTDLDTGLPAHGVDIMEVEYEGKRLINLCNYIDDTVKNISVELNGKRVTKAVNRLTETEIDCTSLALKTNEPILISVEE